MKKLIGLIIFILTYSSAYAGCIPNYSVYQYGGQQVHMKFEGINQTLIEGPVYELEEFNFIPSEDSCDSRNISSSKTFNVLFLKGIDKFYFGVNFFFLIGIIFLFPLLLLSYCIYRLKINLFFKTMCYFIAYSIFGIYFIFYFSLWI